jgi:hypothetical protein
MWQSIKNGIITIVTTIKEAIKFVAKAWTESDSNGGKASFARIAGTFVIWHIVNLGYQSTQHIPPEFMTMFWVLVGYQMVSKILNNMTPAVLDIAKSFLLKVQNAPDPLKP